MLGMEAASSVKFRFSVRGLLLPPFTVANRKENLRLLGDDGVRGLSWAVSDSDLESISSMFRVASSVAKTMADSMTFASDGEMGFTLLPCFFFRTSLWLPLSDDSTLMVISLISFLVLAVSSGVASSSSTRPELSAWNTSSTSDDPKPRFLK